MPLLITLTAIPLATTTVGMSVAGLRPTDAHAVSVLTSLANGSFRTNVGVYNGNDVGVTATVRLFDGLALLGSRSVTLAPRSPNDEVLDVRSEAFGRVARRPGDGEGRRHLGRVEAELLELRLVVEDARRLAELRHAEARDGRPVDAGEEGQGVRMAVEDGNQPGVFGQRPQQRLDAAAHRLRRLAIRRRDDAHVDGNRLFGAHATDRALGEP